jgi:hypothetical protein
MQKISFARNIGKKIWQIGTSIGAVCAHMRVVVHIATEARSARPVLSESRTVIERPLLWRQTDVRQRRAYFNQDSFPDQLDGFELRTQRLEFCRAQRLQQMIGRTKR